MRRSSSVRTSIPVYRDDDAIVIVRNGRYDLRCRHHAVVDVSATATRAAARDKAFNRPTIGN